MSCTKRSRGSMKKHSTRESNRNSSGSGSSRRSNSSSRSSESNRNNSSITTTTTTIFIWFVLNRRRLRQGGTPRLSQYRVYDLRLTQNTGRLNGLLPPRVTKRCMVAPRAKIVVVFVWLKIVALACLSPTLVLRLTAMPLRTMRKFFLRSFSRFVSPPACVFDWNFSRPRITPSNLSA